MMLSALLLPYGDITLSRTVNALSAGTINATLTGGACKSSDAYGSNDCDVDWGKSYGVSVTGSLTKDIDTGATFSADIKVDNLFPLKFTCQLCGANCSFEVPVVKKTVSFAMPPCPIKAQTLDKTATLTLPSSAPVPLTVGFKGTVSAKDAAGNTIADVSVSGDVTPSAVELNTVVETADA